VTVGLAEEPRRRERLYSDREGDHRSEFQRDRDRVLYSSAFRRLSGVTQVLNASEGAAFHNRLIHSLKVAQVARRIAELLNQPDLVDPDVVETAALAHDLGHPPFGHAGEKALNETLLRLGSTEGFEGNAQTFRILTRLSIRPFEGGLNLTRATLAATIKYPWLYGQSSDKKKSKLKWGAYSEDQEAFLFARDLGQVRGSDRTTLEARIMEWADDVAYSVHDLDDAYRSGLIPLDLLIRDESEWKRFHGRCVDSGNIDVSWSQARALRQDLLFPYFDDLNRPFSGTQRQRAALDELSANLIRRFVGVRGQSALRINRGVVEVDLEVESDLQLLKQLMRFYVFDSPGLRAMQIGQQRMVSFLLEQFAEATRSKSKSSGVVVSPFRERLEQLRTADTQKRLRLACDVIASMTEQEAVLMYGRLSGASPGSALDFILR